MQIEGSMMTAKEIRNALENRYPDVTDSEFNIAQSRFAHEHPLIAIGVVLISAIVLATTDAAKLAQYTNYSKRSSARWQQIWRRVACRKTASTIVQSGTAVRCLRRRTGSLGTCIDRRRLSVEERGALQTYTRQRSDLLARKISLKFESRSSTTSRLL